MRKISGYRQHWMAVISDIRNSMICEVLAVNTKYIEVNNGEIEFAKRLCVTDLEEIMV